MTEHEKKDVYIAAGIGGVVLVLIFLYLYGGTATPAATGTNADGTPLPSLGAAATPASPNDYTYNIAPYNPNPGLQLAAEPLTTSDGGCCNNCGPSTGSQYFAPNVSQYMTLVGYGAAAGAN